MFGCKQSSSGSQALVFVCLRLLRQLGASQELPKPSVAGASPRHSCPGRPSPLVRPGEQPEGSGTRTNQSGAQCGRGLLQSRVTARACSILWFGLHEGSGRPRGFGSETFAGGQATPNSRGSIPGLGREQLRHKRHRRVRNSSPGERQGRAAPRGGKEAAVVELLRVKAGPRRGAQRRCPGGHGGCPDSRG